MDTFDGEECGNPFRGGGEPDGGASLGGNISGNGDAQLLWLADDRTGLIGAAARAMGDARRKKSCAHDLESLIRQRVYAIALGSYDLNDHGGCART